LERSNIQLDDHGNLGRRFSAESRRTGDSSERRTSTTPSKCIESADAQSARTNSKDHDHLRLVSAFPTTVDVEPTLPLPVLLRPDQNNRSPSSHTKPSQDDNMILHLRQSVQDSWREYNSGLPTSPQEDRTMWSHAFEKVFPGNTPRNSRLS